MTNTNELDADCDLVSTEEDCDDSNASVVNTNVEDVTWFGSHIWRLRRQWCKCYKYKYEDADCDLNYVEDCDDSDANIASNVEDATVI